jgi:hypothetical protein
MYYKNLGRRRIQEPEEKTSIELLVLNNNDIENGNTDFYWVHSGEFKLNGRYYDVVKKVQSENLLFLYCMRDFDENRLEDELEKLLKKNSLGDKQSQAQINIISEPVQSENSPVFLFPFMILKCLLAATFKSFQCEVPSPPPRIV